MRNDLSTIARYRIINSIESEKSLQNLERHIRPYEVEKIFIKYVAQSRTYSCTDQMLYKMKMVRATRRPINL